MLFFAALLAAGVGAGPDPRPALPSRVERIVLHVLGGPDYARPDRRFLFLTPQETMKLWRYARFGAHWIVWTDGTLWPRHVAKGPPFWSLAPGRASAADRRRIAREAAPTYGHVVGFNDDSVGIEVAHSGRSDVPFPRRQVAALARLLETLLEMSTGRLGAADIVGHKDLDPRPAYLDDACSDGPCGPVYVDDRGTPYRRRVDPPESLFTDLRRAGLDIPRPAGDLDADLRRAEIMPRGTIPSTSTSR